METAGIIAKSVPILKVKKKLTKNVKIYGNEQNTWQQLPYLEVLDSVHRTAEAGSSIRTFSHGSKLPRLFCYPITKEYRLSWKKGDCLQFL